MSSRSNGDSRKTQGGTRRTKSPSMKTSEVGLEQKSVDSTPPLHAGMGAAPSQSSIIGTAGMCLEEKFENIFPPMWGPTVTTGRQPPIIDTSGANAKRKLWDIDDLEEIYGFRRWTIRTYCSQRRIPFVKIGRRVFFDPAAIEAWIKAHERPVKEADIP